jgi:ADP-heptose:LPS heptosyltransferase
MIGKGGDLLKRVDSWLTPVAALAAMGLHIRRTSHGSRTLVVRPGGMGDLILAHLAAERLGIDDRGFTWLIERRSIPWAEHAGMDFLAYDESPASVLRCIASSFDVVINTEQRFGLSMAAARWATARGGLVTAFATNRASRYADMTIPYDWDRTHELIEFSRLIGHSLGKPPAVATLVDRRLPADGTILVALGGGHSASRALSSQDWVAFIRHTVRDRLVEVTAGPREHDLAEQIIKELDGQGTLFLGSFGEVIHRIATAERLVAVDGGAVHIASFYGVPTDALFTAGRASKWAPLGRGSTVYRRNDLRCQPCTVFGQVPPCPYGFLCRHGLPHSLEAFPVTLRRSIGTRLS